MEQIKVNHLSFQYHNNEQLLSEFNMTVHKGEWVSIVGHNGSGKSTLAKLINGILKPTSGSVLVEGFNTADPNQIWEVRKRVGIVFQNPDNQFVGTTVQDDIAFGLENVGIDRQEMIERIDKSVHAVKMEKFLESEPHHLSGGQKQRVAIAGILALQPSVMILDEATSMLDPKGRHEVQQTVRKLNKQNNITVISITHDLEEAIKSDRVLVLKQGKIIEQGTPTKVFQNKEALVDAGLDLPFTIKLRNKLINRGIHVPTSVLTQEELVDALWTSQLKN